MHWTTWSSNTIKIKIRIYFEIESRYAVPGDLNFLYGSDWPQMHGSLPVLVLGVLGF